MKELSESQKITIQYILNVSCRYPSRQLFLGTYKILKFIPNEQTLILMYKIIPNLIQHVHIPAKSQSRHRYETRNRSQFYISITLKLIDLELMCI